MSDEIWQWDATRMAAAIAHRPCSRARSGAGLPHTHGRREPAPERGHGGSRSPGARSRRIAPTPRWHAATRWDRCTACRWRSRRTSIRPAAPRPTASWRFATSWPRKTVRSWPTGSPRARSSWAAPTRLASVSDSTPKTTCAASPTIPGPRPTRPADRAAAPRRRWPRASRRSRTATTSRARSAIPRMPAGSWGCGPRLAGCRPSTLAPRPSARCPRSCCRCRARLRDRCATSAWAWRQWPRATCAIRGGWTRRSRAPRPRVPCGSRS